jgi:colanic acid/amylovoran biosynthesis glycosyltransferase
VPLVFADRRDPDSAHWQTAAAELIPAMLAYIFERFPKFSQTFCYREVEELFRQGVRPQIFSLRAPELGPEAEWSAEILSTVHTLPEGDAFARLADKARRSLPPEARRILREWRGRRDSLRLHQAAYIGVRLRELGVQLVHVHFAGMAARTAYWIRKFFGIPYSVTVHANDIFVPDDFEIGLPEIFGSTRAIVAVSDFAARHLRQEFPEVAGRVHRVYNGIDLGNFETARFDEPPLILSIGRLINKKGFDVLIDACAQLRGSEFRCEIIGDGPLRGDLQAQIQQRDLTRCVSLVGTKAQRDIVDRLRASTIFALPCRVDKDGAMDVLPTVIMEAMATSLPIVSSDVGGISEMVADQQTGFLVAQNDAVATAEAMKRLLRDTEMAGELGRRGRQRCAELFSLEKNVGDLRKIICS